jgi:hypothetical protein
LLEDIESGEVNHRVRIFAIRRFFIVDYLDFDVRQTHEPPIG